MAGKITRRGVLKAAGVGAAAVMVPAAVARTARAQSTATTYGVLVDTRRCVNCKACQISCKLWNENLPDPTTWKTDFTPDTWTYVQEDEFQPNTKYVTTKRQCMHCEDPVCVSSCPQGGNAIHKQTDGPVLVNHDNCIRCLNCVRNCPYGVPQLDVQQNKIVKCTFCVDKLRAGEDPACVSTCVANALKKGTLAEITADAEAAAADGYPVWGLDSGWHTSWIYIFPKGVDPAKVLLP
jgi:Fe-S-cluster-containing dehydrogenase component